MNKKTKAKLSLKKKLLFVLFWFLKMSVVVVAGYWEAKNNVLSTEYKRTRTKMEKKKRGKKENEKKKKTKCGL